MNRLGFIHGVIVAAVLAFAASVVVAAVTPFVGFQNVVRLVIPAISFAYLLFLFRSCDERIGRLTTLSLWSAVAAATWWFSPPLGITILIHVGAVWLVRSLYFYSGVFPSLLDLSLSAFSISAFGWAMARTGSIFLSIWCFFLVQALFVVIPRKLAKAKTTTTEAIDNGKFDRARRQADQALTHLFTK